MIFITSNDDVKRNIPNVLREAQGERPYYDKVLPYMEQVESLLIEEVIDEDYVEEAKADKPLASLISSYIFAEAMHSAVHALDVVLTQNGFGVVSNQNIAPASRERIKSLKESYQKQADSLIDRIISTLLRYSEWRSTDRGMWFTRSLFTHPSSVRVGCPYAEFKEFRSKAEQVEWMLADRAVSHPLFDAIAGLQSEAWSPAQCWLVDRIRDYVKAALVDNPDREGLYRRMSTIVEAIRTNPTAYPQWADTPTARAWEPPVFVNHKSATGYWF